MSLPTWKGQQRRGFGYSKSRTSRVCVILDLSGLRRGGRDGTTCDVTSKRLRLAPDSAGRIHVT